MSLFFFEFLPNFFKLSTIITYLLLGGGYLLALVGWLVGVFFHSSLSLCLQLACFYLEWLEHTACNLCCLAQVFSLVFTECFNNRFSILVSKCCLLKVKILYYALAYVINHIKIVLLPEFGHKNKEMSVLFNVSDYIQPKSTQQIVISFLLCSNWL